MERDPSSTADLPKENVHSHEDVHARATASDSARPSGEVQNAMTKHLKRIPCSRQTQQRGIKLLNDLRDAIQANFQEKENADPSKIVKCYESHRKLNENGFKESCWTEAFVKESPPTFYDQTKLFEEYPTLYRLDGKLFFVVGEPGIGKTTLAREILLQYATTSSSHGDLGSFVFSISFRDIDYSEPVTFFEFLVKPLLPDWEYNGKQDSALLKVLNRLSDVYIVADGLNEAKLDLFSSSPKAFNWNDRVIPDVILRNLLAGYLFPKANVLVTSRPEALYKFPGNYRPRLFVMRLLGLGHETQKNLCRQMCKDDERVDSVVDAVFDKNSHQSGFLYNPVCCEIMVETILNTFDLFDRDMNSEPGKETITFLFTENFNRRVVSQEFAEDEALFNLTQLALSGIKERKFIFEVSGIKTLDKKLFDTFLSNKTSASLHCKREASASTSKKVCFLRTLWQEYFAAYHLMKCSGTENLERFLKDSHKENFEMVLKFLFGFLNPQVEKKIQHVRPTKSEDLHFDEKYLLLKNFFNASLEKGNFVEACAFSFEANDQSLSTDVFNSLPEAYELPEIVGECEAVAISHILKCNRAIRRTITLRTTNWPTFQGNSLQILLNAVNMHGHQMRDILLRTTDFSDREADALSQHINNIDKIVFEGCPFTPTSFHKLCEAIARRNDKLVCIQLVNTRLSAEEEASLASCLWNVKIACLTPYKSVSKSLILPAYEESSASESTALQNRASGHTDDGSLPENLSQVPNLVKVYADCIQKRKWEEAKATLIESARLISILMFPNPDELLNYAGDLIFDGFCLEPILIRVAAAWHHKKEGKINPMGWCVNNIYWAIKRMIENDVGMKLVVKHHVLPIMHDIKTDMEQMTMDDEEMKCERTSEAFHWIAQSEVLIGEHEAAIKIYHECFKLFISVFGNETGRQRLDWWAFTTIEARNAPRFDPPYFCCYQAIDDYQGGPGEDVYALVTALKRWNRRSEVKTVEKCCIHSRKC